MGSDVITFGLIKLIILLAEGRRICARPMILFGDRAR